MVIGLFFALITLPLLGVLGRAALWGLLPFAMGAVAALWWGLRRSYRDGALREVLTLEAAEITLTRHDPRGEDREWRCNPYWAQVTLHPTGGPVPHYITLHGNGRAVEIGAFLAEGERKALYQDLSERLAEARG